MILAVPHREYKSAGWKLVKTLLEDEKGVVADVRGTLSRGEVPAGIDQTVTRQFDQGFDCHWLR